MNQSQDRAAMSEPTELPRIIQGGMGAAVSSWQLAKAVSLRGQLGVVSGTGIDSVLVRRLQDGDPGGHLRRAMAAFPIPRVADEVLRRYFLPEGRPPGTQYRLIPLLQQRMKRASRELLMIASFVEVWLAREGHQGQVGINLLTKIQLPTIPTLYGAMLAGVGWVLMGAGIPREIPGVLDQLAVHQPARLRLEAEGLPSTEAAWLEFNPADCWDGSPPALERPRFLAIVASHSLATMLARKATGRVDGFIFEAPVAGGHNAPPRGRPELSDQGEPVYGPRDVVDLEQVRPLGLPFWLAGGTGSPQGLVTALAEGAAGIQVGTLFAYSEESGLDHTIKHSVLSAALRGEARVRTDPRASPTGYPFKVVEWPSAPKLVKPRERICDLGYLRIAYQKPDGGIGFRCASEPVETFVQKGGALEDTVGRRCLCNGLLAVIGHGQLREEAVELPMVTSGDDLMRIAEFTGDRTSYSADDVLDYLMAKAKAPSL